MSKKFVKIQERTEHCSRISESLKIKKKKKTRMEKVVQKNTTKICEQEYKLVEIIQNGAQRKRTFEIRDMWDTRKISTYIHFEFQERRK